MTAQELIAQLSQLPPNTVLCVWDFGAGGVAPIGWFGHAQRNVRD